MSHERRQTLGEEIANAVTHGVGLVLSVAALPILVGAASGASDRWMLAGYSVFAVSLVLLYGASTVYHALPASRAKQVFQVLDHSAIYLLIAGSYTPFMLGALRGAWGWTLLGIVWSLAVLGIIAKTTFGIRHPRLSTATYLLMGWLAIVAIRPLALHLPGAALAWIVAGGLAYTVGVVFFAWERLRYGHTVWHLFVLTGSVCHFVAVFAYAA